MLGVLLALLSLHLVGLTAFAEDAGTEGGAPALIPPYEGRAGFEPVNAIDVAVLAELRRRGIQPAHRCSDEVFIRRVHIDVIGTLPDPVRVAEFLGDEAQDKRARLVEEVLAREEYADLWTLESLPMPTNIDRYRAAMERLATVQMLPSADLFRAVSRMRRRGLGGGALVLVTGEPDDQDVAVFRAMTRDFNRTIVLSVEDREDDEDVKAFSRAGAVTVVAAPGTPWGPVWRDAMERTWSTVTVG